MKFERDHDDLSSAEIGFACACREVFSSLDKPFFVLLRVLRAFVVSLALSDITPSVSV
jgi:hypothetical protein